ncbi:MAG TPA: hypothetical protein VIG47_10730 [Gemmatimonadaceae bacterium]
MMHATRADFLSNMARGRSHPDDPEQARLWNGLSMYETPAQARATGARFPKVWRSLATIDVPDDERFRLERTTGAAGHWTVWGSPDDLFRCIVAVEPLNR